MVLGRVPAPPGFAFTDENTDAPEVFKGTEVRDPVYPTVWGTVSIVKAEQALLRSALRSSRPLASAFVLLSESCLPVRAFPFARAYLLDGVEEHKALKRTVSGDDDAFNRHSIHSIDRRRSFVESSVDRNARWPGFRTPTRRSLPRKFWRKGSQYSPPAPRRGGRRRRRVGRGVRQVLLDGHVASRRPPHGRRLVILRAGRALRPDAPGDAGFGVGTRLAFGDVRALVADETAAPETFRGAGDERGFRSFHREPNRDGGRVRGGPERARRLWMVRERETPGTKKPCFLFARKFTEKAGRRVGAFASVAIGY